MARKSYQDRISDLEKQKEKIVAQQKALKAKVNQEERKKRTKRLIEIGGAVESVLGKPIEKKDLPNLINFLQQQEERGKYFSTAMEQKE